MTALLRAGLAEAETLSAVERATGLKRQALAKFLRGEQSLRLDLADKLAAYFGIECRPTRRLPARATPPTLAAFILQFGTGGPRAWTGR